MTPADLRALLGATLTPNVPGLSVATARYRVVGFSGDAVRVISGSDVRSALPIPDLEHALTLGVLIIESPTTKSSSNASK